MKIAICLYGLSPFDTKKYGNYEPYTSTRYIEPHYLYKGLVYHSLRSWKENVINFNDVDFFLHCWSEDSEQIGKLKYTLKPKESIFEKIIIEDPTKSATLSIKKVVEILDSYEKKNNFVYDLVLICRYDLVWFGPMNLEKTYNTKKFTVVYWSIGHDEPKQGELNNQWNTPYEGERYGTHNIIFAGSSENIKTYSLLYDKIEEYRRSEKNLTSPHTLQRFHIEKTGLINMIDFKLIPGKDLQIESRCWFHMIHFRNYLNNIGYEIKYFTDFTIFIYILEGLISDWQHKEGQLFEIREKRCQSFIGPQKKLKIKYFEKFTE